MSVEYAKGMGSRRAAWSPIENDGSSSENKQTNITKMTVILMNELNE